MAGGAAWSRGSSFVEHVVVTVDAYRLDIGTTRMDIVGPGVDVRTLLDTGSGGAMHAAGSEQSAQAAEHSPQGMQRGERIGEALSRRLYSYKTSG